MLDEGGRVNRPSLTVCCSLTAALDLRVDRQSRVIIKSTVDAKTSLVYCATTTRVVRIVAIVLPERDYVTFGSLLSQIRLSVVCNVRAPYTRGLKRLAIFLRHFVP